MTCTGWPLSAQRKKKIGLSRAICKQHTNKVNSLMDTLKQDKKKKAPANKKPDNKSEWSTAEDFKETEGSV
jgi:hypothetical protein